MSQVPVSNPSNDDTAPTRVVAIDGPAGAGKSTVARALARKLGWSHLDTGAMFRAVTLGLLEAGMVPPFVDREVGAHLATTQIDLDARGHVLLDGVDRGASLRTPRVDASVSAVAALPSVRARLREVQRAFARGRAVVAEGRDIGTVVFPHAAFKIWLDASVEERARRRVADFAEAGRAESIADVTADIRRRDDSDAGRDLAPLQKADDAVAIDTTGLTIAEVVERLRVLVAAGASTGSSPR